MTYPELHFRWEWRLRASPERLWPFVADTNRFNRDTGLPAVQPLTGSRRATAGPNARRELRFRRFGVLFAWEEEPFEWSEPHFFAVRRRYSKGPISQFRAEATLDPLPNGGTRLTYSTWVQPKNLIGLLGVPVGMWLTSYRSFGAAFRAYDQWALRSERQPVIPETPTSQLAPAGEARLARLQADLTKQSGAPDLVARLVDVVRRGDDVTLAHLRPYVLADAWGVPRRQVLELCLWATRVGLFDLQWDILCPLCRGVQASSTALASMANEVHCPTCNIDVRANFERSIEVTFRPTEAIRVVEAASYCVAGPRVTPHVLSQQLLPPGAERSLLLRLEPGRYRVRALNKPGGQYLVASETGERELLVTVPSDDWPDDEKVVSLALDLHVANQSGEERLVILERTEWSDQAATAAEVTTLQVFRDLFSREILRPGEQISVGSLTVLFTDLRDSTRMYRRLGDAPAFGRVLDHFQVLREEIDREEGAIVKTIGDAVMAVFRRPGGALKAILRAQERVANPPEGALPLHLKVGLHYGPCIAVTLNDRLDYFGTVVNMAARLEGLSTGTDAVISDVVRDDPEVAELLGSPASGLRAERFAAPLKGFDDGEFGLWRVSRQPAAVAAGVT
jgi:class 3 adenylate cyclase